MMSTTEPPQDELSASISARGLDLGKLEKCLDVDLSQYQFLIVSDGSGHNKEGSFNAGASCTIVVSLCSTGARFGDPRVQSILHTQTETSTPRMEIYGLLNGLEWIKKSPDFFVGARILWVTDHKSAVIVVEREAVATTNKDLWLLYSYYTNDCHVTAKHIPRTSNMTVHDTCDLHASTLRELLIEYIRQSIN